MAGRKIDDHSFWAGGMSKESPLPTETKCKYFDSVDGAGELMSYEDTNESLQNQQRMNVKKANSHKMKPNYEH